MRNIALCLVVLLLTLVYVSTSSGADALGLTVSSTVGTTTDDVSVTFKRASDEGFAETTMVQKDSATTTGQITRTFAPTEVKVAERLQETAVLDATVATGVAYFYWDTASETVRVKYRNATGTVFDMYL